MVTCSRLKMFGTRTWTRLGFGVTLTWTQLAFPCLDLELDSDLAAKTWDLLGTCKTVTLSHLWPGQHRKANLSKKEREQH